MPEPRPTPHSVRRARPARPAASGGSRAWRFPAALRLALVLVAGLAALGPGAGTAHAQEPTGTLVVRVLTTEGVPVSGAEVRAGEVRASTNARGEVRLELPAGPVRLEVRRVGLALGVTNATVVAERESRTEVELAPEAVEVEGVTVDLTRSDRRVQDEPLRVEIIGQEEIAEKMLMTPSNIVMLLNETGGLRVQVTSPSLGASNVRIQGMRGRYTQLLADGLPLYGGQAGAIGLLQMPRPTCPGLSCRTGATP